MDKSYVMVAKVYGYADTESIKLFLETAGIEVLVAQESAGKSLYPVTIGKLAQAKIFVRADRAEEAKNLLKDLEDGRFIDTPELRDDIEPE